MTASIVAESPPAAPARRKKRHDPVGDVYYASIQDAFRANARIPGAGRAWVPPAQDSLWTGLFKRPERETARSRQRWGEVTEGTAITGIGEGSESCITEEVSRSSPESASFTDSRPSRSLPLHDRPPRRPRRPPRCLNTPPLISPTRHRPASPRASSRTSGTKRTAASWPPRTPLRRIHPVPTRPGGSAPRARRTAPQTSGPSTLEAFCTRSGSVRSRRSARWMILLHRTHGRRF